MTIDQTLERGIALAKTPEQQHKVEFYITEIAATVERCNAMLDELESETETEKEIRRIRECTKRGILA